MNIKRLILEGENVSLDFKKTISSAEKIAKTLVAFANNRGGKLLIGVADDGTISGVKSEEEEKYMITKAAHQFCKPAIEHSFEEVYFDEKLVLVVDIPKSDLKPHYALDENKKWWVYFRVKDKSILASKIIVDVLKESAKETGQFISYSTYEQKLLSYLAEHGRITFKEYAKLINSSHKKAQRVMVTLILAGVIFPHLSEKEEYFTAAAS
ncbi:AlbA family DNA-binding domain-containing protein [Pedobacter insulae]|uniref:Putative DNA-binding domain-containing protein n=1 Tax=Pedobacter insulae TaxID=414048 RepID=A0A1I2YKS0_9SPHI|nr:ATP-binding protein [Pedobacter insulae]SFH26245.1 Putative DNA-binding domain-containing protein [Pedobacter insulae]